MTYGILVSQPGIKLVPLAVKTRVLNHWTTKEFPGKILLLNRMFFRSFHTVSIMKSVLLLLSYCMNEYMTIFPHSLVNRFFFFYCDIKKAVTNILVTGFVDMVLFISLVKYLGVELLGYRAHAYLSAKQFSKWLYHFTLPSTVYESSFFTSLSELGTVRCFNFSHSESSVSLWLKFIIT